MKFKLHISTNKNGSDVWDTLDVDDSELEGKTQQEIDDYIQEEYFNQWVWENINAYFEPVEE